LGVALFERRGRGIVLSDAGRELERRARQIVALLDEARSATVAAASPGARRLRLAAVTTAAEYLVPVLLREARARRPELEVELEVANRDRVWERLAHFEAELAVGGRPPGDGPFRSLATAPNVLVVAGPPGGVTPSEGLGRATWLLREPGSGTRLATEEFFEALGISPPRLTIGSNGAIRECVRIGLGLALLSRDAVARELEAGELALVPTALTPLARAWHLVCNSERELGAAASAFVAEILASGPFRTLTI
ncbi:MAG: LysR substrate-binding domain-containing protein, partial [Vulcanimicrobiaceae bacterium]